MDSEFVAYVLRQLQVLGPVTSRAMSGGQGLHLDEVMFGIVHQDALFLRVDEITRLEYVAAGMGPFVPPRGKHALEEYYELPLDVLESREKLAIWGAKALAIAQAEVQRKSGASKRTKKKDAREELKNLGPVSLRWLADAGIRTRADLERVGSVVAFRKVAEAGHKPSANLLYALEGALLDLRWDLLGEDVKHNLLERAGLAVPKKSRR